jgi:hypothetical protein
MHICLGKSPIIISSIALSYLIARNSGVKPGANRINPEYDKRTGRLQTLRYDSNGDGRVDMTSTMDGARVTKIEIDKDFDGHPDRWEYYDAQLKLEKVGFSRASDGKEDAWSLADAAGNIERIDVSTKRDGTIQRVEHYKDGMLVRADEDTNGDGKPDKWETCDGDRLAMVAYDTLHRGTADRRLIYGVDGTAHLEFDAKGNGTWTPR